MRDRLGFLKGAVAQFTETHGRTRRGQAHFARLSLVQSQIGPAVAGLCRASNLKRRACARCGRPRVQGDRQPVLAWIHGKALEHRRCCYCPGTDRRRRTQQLIPMLLDVWLALIAPPVSGCNTAGTA